MPEYSTSALPPIEETADSEEDDKDGDDEGPDVGDTRSGGDAVLVVVGNSTVTRDTVVDDIAIVFTHTSIQDPTWHHKVVVSLE